MRSTSMTTPMLTLPHDVLSEVALRLPAVGSTKPWRDVNSLAITCRGLRNWKTKKVDKNVKTEWKRVCAEVAKTKGWRDALEKILKDFEHPSRRLFREPILRKIAEKKLVTQSDKINQSYGNFITTIFEGSETASSQEICEFLARCDSSSLDIKKRFTTLLPSFLRTLLSEDRQKVLRSMFNLIDKDKELRKSFAESKISKKIEESLGDDRQSKVLLKLCLVSRNLLSHDLDMDKIGFGLIFIPDDKRWQWVLDNVPECLNATSGMKAMLNDSVCQKKIIDHLSKSFSDCTTDLDRLTVCEKISRICRTLCKCLEGKELLKNVIKWFFKAPACIHSTSGYLKTNYVNSILNYLPHIKNCLGKKEKKLLQNKLFEAFLLSIKAKAYDQTVSIVIGMAKDDIKQFSNFSEKSYHMTIKEVVKGSLKRARELGDLDNREEFIFVLRKLARTHIKSDPDFFQDFVTTADKIMKAGSNSEKPHHNDDYSLSSES